MGSSLLEHGPDAAQPRAHRALLDDAKLPQLAGVLDVRAAAYLLAKVADRVYPDPVAVAFLEQTNSPSGLGLLDAHLFPGNGQVSSDLLVDDGFCGL